MKTKVYFEGKGHRLNMKMFAEHCEVVDDLSQADIAVCWKRPPNEPFPYERIVLCQSEPPIVDGIRIIYNMAKRWHTFVTYDPFTENAIPFSETAPHLFPFWPWIEKRVRRPDEELRIKGNGIYFAGHRSPREDLRVHKADLIYQKRANWAERLAELLEGNSVCVGNGWPVSTKDAENGWHESKFEELDQGDYDFHFCAENSLLSGYVSEKFWHGLIGDRLMVYMGHPRIKELVPEECYIFAEHFPRVEDLGWYLTTMSNHEYRFRLDAARQYLDSIEDRPWRAEMDKLTMRIIERVNA